MVPVLKEASLAHRGGVHNGDRTNSRQWENRESFSGYLTRLRDLVDEVCASRRTTGFPRCCLREREVSRRRGQQHLLED